MNKDKVNKIAKDIVSMYYGYESLTINMQLLNEAYRYNEDQLDYESIGDDICKLGQKIKLIGDNVRNMQDINGNTTITLQWK